MPLKTITGEAGLWLDSSTVKAPPNALRLANNVLLHKPGIIRPRFGWRSYDARSTAYRPYVLIPFGNAQGADTIVIALSGSTYEMTAAVDNTTFSTADLTMVPPGIADSIETKHAQARDSLYVTSTKGVCKLASTSDLLERAGVYTDYIAPVLYAALRPVATDTGVAVVTQKTVAYRYVWARTDSNGYERRSPASQRIIFDNTDGTYSCDVTFDRIKTPLGVVEGDRIEIYRTVGVTNGGVAGAGAPTEEYYLTVTYYVSAGDATNEYIDVNKIVDSTPDDQLGETLYVSPSQGGETANSKEPPPSVRDLAHWQGVLWGAYVVERAFLSIEFLHARLASSDSSADRSRDRLGWGYLSGTCGFTNGSAVVTITASPTTARVVTGSRTGQYIYDSAHPATAGTRVPALTTITAIRTKITIDNAKLNIAGNPDSILLGDVRFTWDGGGTTTSVTKGATSTDSATNLAAKINAYTWKTGLGSTTDGNAYWSLAATSSGAVVTITDADGYGVHGADITLANAGNADGMVPSYEYTMSANATNTSSATTRRTDWLTINSVKFYASEESVYTFLNDSALYTATDCGLSSREGYSNTGSGNDRATCVQNAAGASAAVNAYQVSELATDRGFGVAALASDTTLSLIGATPDKGAITVQCTVKPDAFRPRLLATLTSALRTHPGRVVWSMPDEPEAFTPLSYVDVGDPQKGVDRIIALRDAILIWKRDGLYRITGVPPDQWRVDPIDLTLRLEHPECVCVLENVCYAWTNRGVMSVTEAGLGDTISMPIQSALRDMQVLLEADTTQTHRGFFMSVHERDRLVILSVKDTSVTGQVSSNAQYVFHLSTGVWSKWTRSQLTMVWSQDLGRMIEASALGEWLILQESREVEDEDQSALEGYSDWKQSSIADTETTGSYVISVLVSAVTPREFEVGDVIAFNDGYGRVTDAQSNGTTWTITTTRLSAATGANTISWHKRIDAQVQWHAQTMGSPGVGAHWQEAVATVESTQSYLTSWPLEIGGASHIQARDAVETVTATITADNTANVYSKPVRVGLPRNICRSPTLYPYARIRVALTNWAISTMSLRAREAGTRVSR